MRYQPALRQVIYLYKDILEYIFVKITDDEREDLMTSSSCLLLGNSALTRSSGG